MKLPTWIVCALLLLPTVARAQGQPPAPTAVRVSVDRANVRERADITSPVVASVVRGDELDVLATSGVWYRVRIRSSRREGFIQNQLVERLPGAAPLPAPAAPVTPATPGPVPATPPRPAGTSAQARPATPAARPSAGMRLHARGFVGGELFSPAASNTFSALAISGSPRFKGISGGGDVWGLPFLPLQTFARVGVSQLSLDAESVFVVGTDVYSTGLPLRITMTPIQIGGGMRFPLKARPARTPVPPRTPTPPPTPPRPGTAAAARRAPARPFITRLTPYAGAGVVILRYQEFSDFADDADNAVETHKGLSVFGGVDVNLWKFVGAGVEAEFRRVKGFGEDGISKQLGDDQLGGFAIKFSVSVSK